jgi:uncharacterized membrane protein
MKTNLIAFFVALVAFLLMDAAWLGVFAKGFYAAQVGGLLLAEPRWGAAALFYPMFIAGVVLFVVHPAIEAHSLMHALVYGALFGIVCYATYDLTNLATIRGWTTTVVVVDIVWGAIETAVAASIAFAVVALLTK